MNKYNAKRTTVNNLTFDSKREANRYLDLLSREQVGEIRELVCKPRWELIVNRQKIGRYTADFSYIDQSGIFVVEDAKGVRTRDYILRKKLMRALYGIEVKEV